MSEGLVYVDDADYGDSAAMVVAIANGKCDLIATGMILVTLLKVEENVAITLAVTSSCKCRLVVDCAASRLSKSTVLHLAMAYMTIALCSEVGCHVDIKTRRF